MNNAELHTQLVARNELIDAQAAQLIAARAQVVELSVTVEQLADINAHMRQQLDKSNALILELNHQLVALRAQVEDKMRNSRA